MRAMIVKDGKAVDAVELPPDWSGADGEWQPPANTEAVSSDTALIGDDYDGETFTTPEPPPPNYDAADWLARIAAERERRLNTSIPVTLSDGDYIVPVTDRAAAQAPEAARRARADTEDKTRPFPTDRGIVERSPDDLDAIGDALDRYMTAVWRRAGDLEDMVADGTITEKELEQWPSR